MLRTKRPSVYLLMHGLLDRGVEPGTASVAIDLVLDHPTEEEDPLDGLADEWEPSYEPSEEDADWLSQLDVEEAARYAAWVDIREAEARLSRYTDHDLAAAGLAVG